jgi:hypothetical protein
VLTQCMNSLIAENGRQPKDTSGAEGRQEEQGQEHLQLQARSPNGVPPREKRDFIVRIENSTKYERSFIIKEVGTAEELFDKICDYLPYTRDDSVGLRVSDTRMGTMHRVFYEDKLPMDKDSLFVSLYLKRHPPLSYRKN